MNMNAANYSPRKKLAPWTCRSAGRSIGLSRGFTLIEVMIVVVILAILAVAVVPRIMGRPDEARVAAARTDISVIMQQLKLYRLDNTFYPSTDQGLQALIVKPTTNPVPANWKQGGYLERLPNDPWNRPYQFLNPGLKGEIDVFSLGADGQPGGEGVNADIGSWGN
jgi:general secretion pathway protein G